MAAFIRPLLERVEADPDAVVLHHYPTADSCEGITAGALARSAGGRARLLADSTRAGEFVFIVDPDPLEQIQWWVAALVMGAVPGILTPPTPKLDPDRYARDLATTLAAYPDAHIVASGDLSPALLADAALAPRIVPGGEPVTAADLPAPRERPSGAPLIFQQSSGTTGLRKGVLFGEDAVVRQLDAYGRAIGRSPDDCIVSWLPLYHDMGLVACLMQAVHGSVPLALCSPFTWLAEPRWLVDATARHGATLCWLPNFAFNVMVERVPADSIAPGALSSLRLVTSCSEPVLAASLAAFAHHFEPCGLDPQAVSSSYAMAENVFGVTQSAPGHGVVTETVDRARLENDGVAVRAADGRTLAASGSVIDGVEVRIVDEGGDSVDDGHVGTVELRSDHLMAGYVGIGADKSVIDPAGWLNTGDRGYVRDGDLFVLGRGGDRIIRAGRNLDPNEIETAAAAVDGIRPGRVVAFGLLNEREGTEDVVVLAEFGGDRVGDVDAIRAALSDRLASELDLAVQTAEVVRPGWLVKSSSGKLSRSACHDRFERMRAARSATELIEVGDWGGDIPDELKDSFGYFGHAARIRTPAEIAHPARVHIGNWVSLGRRAKILMLTDFSVLRDYTRQHYPGIDADFDPGVYGPRTPRLKIGDGTSIGDDALIACARSITIGRHVLMSSRVFISDSNHVTDHPELPIAMQANTLGSPVVIEDGAWIGIGACILEGVRIGRGAVISANTVVTSDVPARAVVAGNPGRVVRLLDDESGDGAEAASPPPPRPAGSAAGERETRLTALLVDQISERVGFPVDAEQSLFRSGLIDSLGVLDILVAVEDELGTTVSGEDFARRRPDTVREIVAVLRDAGA